MRTTTCVLASALLLLAGSGLVAAPFRDVPKKHWAFDEVHWLRADGMLEGWGGGFHGNRKFTRYEMAKVLSRYMKKYDAERRKVEAELGSLRQEDDQQRAQINDLFGRTSELETRMASLDGQRAAAAAPVRVAPPIRVAPPVRQPPPVRVPPPVSEPPPVFDDTGMAAAVERRLEAQPDPDVAVGATEPPIEVAPVEPVEPEPPAFVDERGAGSMGQPETEQPAGRDTALSDRIAALRERIRQRREKRESASGGDDEGDAAIREAMEDLAGTDEPEAPAAPAPSVPVEAPEAPEAPVETAPPPVAEEPADTRKADGGDLSGSEQDRYQAIRERYLRMMEDRRNMPVEPPPETERVVVPGIDAVGADPSGMPATQQPLPGVAPRSGSRPIDSGSTAQPLPGMSARPSGDEELELPSVGMGLGYAGGI